MKQASEAPALTSIRVWGRLNSANVQKVLWCLDDLRVGYDLVLAGGTHHGLGTNEFRALNPNQLVPVLVDRDVALWESNTIVRYLCKQYAPDMACRADPLQQAAEERWTDWYGTELGSHMTTLWGHFKRGKVLPHETLELHLARATQLWAMLENAIPAASFIGGRAPGVSDYCLGAAIHRWVSINNSAVSPNLFRWHSALAVRPAYQQHIVAAPL
ncbi:glutathione S-transferase N-terminal domain-containing protein [Paraburkholderia sediminicola]|uniref:glutathione S-transferase N-terminal domain-containing protein n=1 Tax=Paraburkholderia sediminicola TaxID=458836 RepID=UPI0038B86B36